MITRTSRIRWVETPGVPVPGAVPPATPPAGVPGAYAPPAGSVPPVVPPTVPPVYAGGPGTPGAPKKGNKGLLIGLLAGGGVLVIVAIIALVALVLPAILGGGSSQRPDVADIAEEPETTWNFDWVGDADEEYLYDSPNVQSVGENLAIVFPEFDYSAYASDQGDSAGWYKGYDEDYDLGYAAGLEYLAAYDLWWEDYTAPYPDREDYYPDGYEPYDSDTAGFDDGFFDAYYEDGEGYSKKEEPVDPDYTPVVTLLNTATGDDEWAVDLSEAVDGVDFSSFISVYSLGSADAVAVVTSTANEDGDAAYVLTTLDKSNGKVLSQLESETPLAAAGFDGDVIVQTQDEDEKTTIGRYGVGSLDDDAIWEIDGPDGGAYLGVLADKWIRVSNDEEGFVIDGATGDEAEFGDDIDESVSYFSVAGQIIRAEQGKSDSELVGINPSNGDETWGDPIDAEGYSIIGDSLYTYEVGDEEYSELLRIDPSNGSEKWGETFGEDFEAIRGYGDTLLLGSGKNVYVVNAGNGEEKFTQKVGSGSSIYTGANSYYVYSGDALGAYGYGEKGDIWEFDLDDDETISVVGGNFVLVDGKGELHGLG